MVLSDSKMNSHQILLFGDLSSPFQDELETLLHVRDNPLLTSFFEQIGAKIRDEIGCLGSNRQRLFPRFTTLIDLTSKLDETEGAPILRFCLLSVCQVGQFINHYGRAGRLFPSSDDTSCLGICAGSFAAAGISCSRTLVELIPAAIEAALFAFRTALASFIMRNDIAGDNLKQDSNWSVIVAGDEDQLQRKIDSFAAEESIHQIWRPYMSAVTPSHVTLSGHPAVLKKFVASNQLRAHQLPIQSPYHASHLFDDVSVQAIIDQSWDTEFFSNRPNFQIVSPSTGGIIEAKDFKAMIKQAVKDSLCNKVQWRSIVEETLRNFKESGITSCKITSIGSNAAQLLSANLEKHGVKVEVGKITAPVESSPQNSHFADSKVAIIGYSGRFPDSASNEEFWELLRAGRDVHQEIPADRFNWKTHYDPTGKTKNTSRIKHGCFIKEPGLFDARFFNISPREAENTDPAQRLAITTVYEAMEMAGMVPNRTPSTQQDRIGVFFGTTSDDWREVNSGQNVDTYFIPGGNRAFIPGRISYFFRFSGPSLCMDTACSSSFAAIQTACAYLWRGECDTAVAGGTNILTNPDNFVGLDRGHFLSTTGNCNAFDDGADGYCRADAVGSVILKRLEDAEMDNDPIFGIISGATTNHCGQTDSITRPHEGDQSSVLKRIIRHAGVNPLDVSYIEMHGTGTQAGDATEMNSVLSVFVPDNQRMPRHPLYIGSAKANIGHAESASGVSSLIKVLMMMKHDEIPPHCGIKTKINHNYPLDLKERNVNVALKPTAWRRDQVPCGKRYAFLNNFSAAGGNTAILLEDAPLLALMNKIDPRAFHIITVSSKTAKSLKGNIEACIKHLENNPEISASALSYTTTARRLQHNYRVAIVGVDAISIAQSLKSKLTELEPKPIPPTSKVPQVAFVFTGQGSFYSGIAKELFNHISSFRDDICRFNQIAFQQGFPSFVSAIDGTCSSESQDAVTAQLTLTCVQMALTRLWRSWGVRPALAIGHSLGEYAALFAAGVLSASDTIYLVGSRAKLLVQHCTSGAHSMLAVKAPLDTIKNTLEGSSAEIACLNQPTSTVISGKVEDIEQLKDAFKARGHEATQLDLLFAFHSSQVEPMLADFETVIKGVKLQPPNIPYISSLLASTVSPGSALPDAYLARACREMVNFQGALEAAANQDIVNDQTLWLEIGAHPTCSGMIKGTLGPNAQTMSTLRKDTDTWKVLAKSLELIYLNGIEIDWNEYHREFTRYNQVIELPRYCWDLKNYWIMYRNDFCLTKGENVSRAIEAPKSYKYISPSLQRVIEEKHGLEASSILVESDVHDDSRLAPIFSGHKVNGAELCPSSLYADIAMHLTTYLMKEHGLAIDSTGLDVCQMQVDKPLVSDPKLAYQLFRVSAEIDWSQNKVNFKIFSVRDQGKKTLNHATCAVEFVPAQKYLDEWKRNTYLIRSRIEALRQAVDHGDAHKLKRSIIYKLFANIVEYSPAYQGMEEVTLDSSQLEAVSTVRFQSDGQGFFFNPQWIDSVGHVAGFVMNGSDSPHPKAEVFINHGWDNLRCARKFERGKTYYSYNHMQHVEGTLYAGDTYIFDGDQIIAMVQGIKFMGVPRRVLDKLRPSIKPTQPTPPIQSPNPMEINQKKPAVDIEAPQQTAQTPPSPATAAPGRVWLGILAIISEEVGVAITDLKPDTDFIELGLDSLLSLTITGRIREELSLDLPSSIFVEHSTVKEMQQQYGSSSDVSTSSSSGRFSSGVSTPETCISSEKGDLDVSHVVRSTIAEETGIGLKDLSPSVRMEEVGMDSLLALTTLSRLGEILETDLPNTLFSDNNTVQEVENAILQTLRVKVKPSSSPTPIPPLQYENDPITHNAPHATSLLLQGSPTSATSTVFMFPDGSGSASSYANLARLGPNIAVYGLNCPWRTTPKDMAKSGCTLAQLSAKFVKELRRRQPQGPYYLGGWSAGGICAFEATRQLVASGEVVESLVLIDTPNPIGLQNPPARMYDFFQELGIFGKGSKVPTWLRQHFDAFIQMLDDYEPTAWPRDLGPAPRTVIIYAEDGVCKDPSGPRPEFRGDDPREMIWLLDNRTDFSADGWASLIGRERLSVEVLEEVDHFNMMDAGPQMGKLGEYMQRALVL